MHDHKNLLSTETKKGGQRRELLETDLSHYILFGLSETIFDPVIHEAAIRARNSQAQNAGEWRGAFSKRLFCSTRAFRFGVAGNIVIHLYLTFGQIDV